MHDPVPLHETASFKSVYFCHVHFSTPPAPALCPVVWCDLQQWPSVWCLWLMLVGAPISPALVPHKSNELLCIAPLFFPSLTFPSYPPPPNVSPSLTHDQLRPSPALSAGQHFSAPGPLLRHSFTLRLFGCRCQIHRETGSRPKVVEKKETALLLLSLLLFSRWEMCVCTDITLLACAPSASLPIYKESRLEKWKKGKRHSHGDSPEPDLCGMK